MSEICKQLDPKELVFSFAKRNVGRTNKHKRYILDSGATVTVINDPSLFKTIERYNSGVRVQVANKSFVNVELIGTIEFSMLDRDGNKHTFLLSNVHYSPHFSTNLLSVDEMWRQHRVSTHFAGDSYLDWWGVQLPVERSANREYQIHAFSTQAATALPAALWHKRFMHVGNASLKRMQCCIEMQGSHDSTTCDACLRGGAKKLPFGHTPRRSRADQAFRKPNSFKTFGERIASDLCDMEVPGIDGEKYAIIFHDSATKYAVVYCLKDKTRETVLAAFQQFLVEHQQFLPNGVGVFWTDNGGEYQNADMDKFCEEICVRRAWTIPYSSPQNPYAERAWGVALRKVRTAIAASGTPARYWPYAIKHAILVHNILADDQCISPYKRVHGEDYNYSRLRVLFSLCYYLVPERDRASKLSPTALAARYLGPDPDRKGHMVETSTGIITSGYHVVFNENRYYLDEMHRKMVSFDENGDVSTNDSSRRRRQYRETRDSNDAEQPIDDAGNRSESESEQTDGSPSRAGPVPLRQDLDASLPSNDARHGDMQSWSDDHCERSTCTYPRGHSGLHSDEELLPDGSQRGYFRPRNRQIYECCSRDDDCVFHVDHSGPCEDCDAKQINESIYDDDDDPTSIMDFDPMVSHVVRGTSIVRVLESYDRVMYVPLDDVTTEGVLRVKVLPEGLSIPQNFDEATKGLLSQKWWDSMQEEITALIKNNTWQLVSRSDPRIGKRRITKSRWVYDIKLARDGTVSRYKSRFVVCGYSQREGIDYERAFSATLRATTFRTLLAVAAGEKLRLAQYDVSNAFTQAKMDDVDLFVEPARGFEEFEIIGDKRRSKVLHLLRALYGTKQASRLWQDTLRKALLEIGFIQSTADPCIYRWRRADGQTIILGVYVDDIILAYSNESIHKEFQDKFCKRFTARYEGDLRWFLGMAIDQAKDYSIKLDHSLAISKAAERFIPHNTITRECPPADLFNKLSKAANDEEREKVKDFPYKSIVGTLLYIAVMSRADVVFHTSMLAKFMSDPSSDCCKAAIQLLQYLHATRDLKLNFSGKVEIPEGLSKYSADITRNHGFVGYSDSSWGNAIPYPMFGFGVYMYGSLISFSSKQLKTVAFSSCEAEYAAAAYTCKEIEFVRNICFDMGVMLQGRLVIAVDNTAAIAIAHDVGVSGRTKHFNQAIHFFRDLTQLRRVLPVYISTDKQRADGYTKALDKSKFLLWRSKIVHK